MKYGTVFSGIEAPTVAWHQLGWEPQWFSEIDPFAKALLAHHYPNVPDLGDMTQVDWSECRGSVDLVCGGSPCQSFSVAGLRRGLYDPRGNLTLEYLRVIDQVRPEWVAWENVPGVLSMDGGRAFGAFVGGLGQLGYGWAYRVLDAQYYGVAQRRRRVFLVGRAGDWRGPAAVLFERESLRRNPPPSREAGQGAAPDAAPCIGASGRGFERARETRGQDPVVVTGPVSHCLNAGGMGRQDYETETLVPQITAPIAFHNRQDPGHGEVTHTLGAQDNGLAVMTLALAGNMQVRRFTPRECERLQGFPDDYTLIPLTRRQRRAVNQEMAEYYRRTQPGLSDEIIATLAKDGPRYKALGNSMAVPVMRWIGERIEFVDTIMPHARERRHAAT